MNDNFIYIKVFKMEKRERAFLNPHKAACAIPSAYLYSFINRLKLTPEQLTTIHWLREKRDEKIDNMFRSLTFKTYTRDKDINRTLDRIELKKNGKRINGHKLDTNRFPIFRLKSIYNYNRNQLPFAMLDVMMQLEKLKHRKIPNPHDYTFRPIPGFNYIYITKTGIIYDVYRKKIVWKHLKKYKTSGWYVGVYITSNDGKGIDRDVHRLLALTYINVPKHLKFVPKDKLMVNHLDGDKTNFSLENLEWCTQAENNKHAMRNGLNNSSSIYPIRKIKVTNPITGRSIVFNTMGEAAEIMQVTKLGIYEACNRPNKNHKGYIYEYA